MSVYTTADRRILDRNLTQRRAMALCIVSLGGECEDVHDGLLINNRVVVAIKKPKYRLLEDYEWVTYEQLKSVVDLARSGSAVLDEPARPPLSSYFAGPVLDHLRPLAGRRGISTDHLIRRIIEKAVARDVVDPLVNDWDMNRTGASR